MPVEIRELQIITVVKEDGAQTKPVSGSKNATDTDKVIAACVEQVLEILKQKNER
jgi:hypothetical protein